MEQPLLKSSAMVATAAAHMASLGYKAATTSKSAIRIGMAINNAKRKPKAQAAPKSTQRKPPTGWKATKRGCHPLIVNNPDKAIRYKRDRRGLRP